MQATATRTAGRTTAFSAVICLRLEKHASGLYDTGIFEFTDPKARKMLNHIQADEQQHGEQIAAFMKSNGMYC